MQKYKIVASKSQKKYTIIVSADSEAEAKEKLHEDGYSLLSVMEVWDDEIQGKKFIFQVEKEGELKNGIIIWKDIYKVYKKLKDDLWYHIVYIYPEGDEAENNAKKKQFIMDQLDIWYKLQQQKEKMTEEKKSQDESFYLKKELDDTYALIEKVLYKLDNIFTHKVEYNISEEKFLKIEAVYEKLKQIKKSTNLAKLRQIGEKALMKIAEIEIENIGMKKDKESKLLLKETNSLLKKIGSNKSFKEEKSGASWKINELLSDIKENLFVFWKKWKKSEKRENKIDKESYSFLKTILLLEKYKEKLKDNTRDLKSNIFMFINIFDHSEEKEKILLKRKVIQQNIALLKAKKNGSMSSYTGIKKWIYKIIEGVMESSSYLWNILIFLSIIYIYIFLLYNFGGFIWVVNMTFTSENVIVFLFLFSIWIIFSLSRSISAVLFGVVFLCFLNIFIGVNF